MSNPKSRTYEKKVVHPVAKRWLDERGYTYKYEAPMPEYGTVDFRVATSDGELLVECKAGSVTGRDVVQLLDYMRQIPSSKGAMAVPAEAVDDRLTKICSGYGIQVIALDVPLRPKKEIWQHRFNLSSDDPDQACLHEFLAEIAERGDATNWIRKSLKAAMPTDVPLVQPIVQEPTNSPFRVLATIHQNKPELPLIDEDDAPEDTVYAPVEDIP